MAAGPQSDDEQNGGTTDANRSSGRRVDRRSYLKLLGTGATLAVSTAATGRASAATTVNGISFDNVVNIVDDYGADPTGKEPVNDAVRQAISAGTLIKFPEGTYRFGLEGREPIAKGALIKTGVDGNIGMLGEGDVTFVQPSGSSRRLFTLEPANKVLFKNIDIDQTADNTSSGLRVYTQNGFHVEDVEFLGRGLTTADYNPTCLLCIVRNSDATGTVRRLVAKKGSAWNRYNGAGGKIGVFVGTRNRGRVRIEDCHFEEMGNNGIYASRNTGDVQVEGGIFRNNSPASMRISGEGSYVDGAFIEYDEEKYTGPSPDDANTLRGIVVEQGSKDTGGFKPAGAAVRNCDIVFRSFPGGGDPIQIWGGGRSLSVENTRIHVENSGSMAVNRRPAVRQGRHPPGPEPRWVRMKNVTITGNASGAQAVELIDANGSRVENCTIRQTGSNRNGVDVRSSSDCVVSDSSIDVSGTAVSQSSSQVQTSGISNDVSDVEPVPTVDNRDRSSGSGGGSGDDGGTSDGGSSGDSGSTDDGSSGGSGSDGGDDGGSGNESGEGSFDHTIEIDGSGDPDARAHYELTVEGDIRKNDSVGTINDGDAISGSTADGYVDNGSDGYDFNGAVTAFSLDGDAVVRLDGERVDPGTLGSGSSDDGSADSGDTDDGSSNDETWHTLQVDGRGVDTTTYAFSVSGNVEEHADLGAHGYGDAISGSDAEGSVNGGADGYRFTGSVTSVTVDGPADLLVDGEVVDPATLGADAALDRTIQIVGRGGRDEYEFTVDGELAKSADLGTVNNGDVVSGSSAEGFVWGGTDGYQFSGSITSFSMDGDAEVRVDGEAVDPSTLDSEGDTSDLTHRVEIDGDGSTYSLSVDGDLAKGDLADDGDTIEQGVATGTVGGDPDSFQFSGAVTSLDVDGDAVLSFEEL